MIENFILQKTIFETFDIINKFVNKKIEDQNKFVTNKKKKKYARIELSHSSLENSLNTHLKTINNWSKNVSFNDINEAKSLLSIYIHLDFFLTPIKRRLENEEGIKVALEELFQRSENHIIVLGQPGAGKTTSMKYLCQKLMFDGDFDIADLNFPIFIRLRDFDDKKNIKVFGSSMILSIVN